MRRRTIIHQALILITIGLRATSTSADEPLSVLRPVFVDRCLACHDEGGEAVDVVDLSDVTHTANLTGKPEFVADLLEAIDSGAMPPDGEPPLPVKERERAVGRLRELLREAVADRPLPRTPIRRMTRMQYDAAVRDLLELNVVVFPLPERMMREHGGYFRPETGRMPDAVKVGSRPLGKSQLIENGLLGVTPYPQDLRAEHGFDNRGDHLTLSPLLLESFLKLGQSIAEAPNLNPKTCGIWPTFFAPPNLDDSRDTRTIVRQRLGPFLRRAFRGPVDEPVLDRYVGHVVGRIEGGADFTSAMRSALAAVLASPRFLYLHDGNPDGDPDYALASRLSFLLWGSLPDDTLLERAASGTLREPDVLRAEVRRMLRDRKLKRFCDAFPTQWLQLERIVSSTPDRDRYPQFYFAKYRASMHMMLEPLLVFETVLIENRPVIELIDPDFSYRSDLLEAWYRDGSQGNAGPPTVVTFRRVPLEDRRFGGVITNAAVMTMTSSATRTQPITRGAWLATVVLNDPPEPPPADVPVLPEKPSAGEENLTLRERFAAHRTRPDCAGCHTRIDPLGFALENFDAAGIWRETYENGRTVDPAGTLFGRHEFTDVVEFKDVLLTEKDRFTRAFAAHLLSYALGRELDLADGPSLDEIVRETAADEYRFHTLIEAIVTSRSFQ